MTKTTLRQLLIFPETRFQPPIADFAMNSDDPEGSHLERVDVQDPKCFWFIRISAE